MRDMVRRACGKADSSENQEAAYACFVMVLEPSPPTTYHGQESARGGHTGSYSSAMFKNSTFVDDLEKKTPHALSHKAYTPRTGRDEHR